MSTDRPHTRGVDFTGVSDAIVGYEASPEGATLADATSPGRWR
ncbi:hypothetical protein OG592_02440 [Streptomyces avidinii]|nr:hypothetical protein OG592_02440 [Streptomyces avidinii]